MARRRDPHPLEELAAMRAEDAYTTVLESISKLQRMQGAIKATKAGPSGADMLGMLVTLANGGEEEEESLALLELQRCQAHRMEGQGNGPGGGAEEEEDQHEEEAAATITFSSKPDIDYGIPESGDDEAIDYYATDSEEEREKEKEQLDAQDRKKDNTSSPTLSQPLISPTPIAPTPDSSHICALSTLVLQCVLHFVRMMRSASCDQKLVQGAAQAIQASIKGGKARQSVKSMAGEEEDNRDLAPKMEEAKAVTIDEVTAIKEGGEEECHITIQNLIEERRKARDPSEPSETYRGFSDLDAELSAISTKLQSTDSGDFALLDNASDASASYKHRFKYLSPTLRAYK